MQPRGAETGLQYAAVVLRAALLLLLPPRHALLLLDRQLQVVAGVPILLGLRFVPREVDALLVLLGLCAFQQQKFLGEGLALRLQVSVEAFEEVAFDHRLLQFLASAIQLQSEAFGLLEYALHLLLVDLEELAGLEFDNALLEFPVLAFQLAHGLLQLLRAGQIDFSGGLGIIGCLGICKEGFLGTQLMEAVLDVLRTGGLVALRPAKLLQNFVSALLTHIYYMKSRRGELWVGRSKGSALPLSLINQIQMSTTKTITLSMQSLNKLYFQFFDRYVTPNLLKSVNEINQLLRNRTAYDVYKYLEELISRVEAEPFNVSASNGSSTSNAGSNLYQYALPTSNENKTTHSEHLKGYEKSDKIAEDSISFKNKLGVRRTMTGLAYDQPKTRDFRNYNDEIAQNPSLYTNPSPPLSSEFKLDYPKDPLPPMPILTPSLSRGDSEQSDKGRAMKQIVRKLGKIFNENHSKIEKYNRNTESNKLFNINTSTRLDKKDDLERVKSYQFHGKSQQPRRY